MNLWLPSRERNSRSVIVTGYTGDEVARHVRKEGVQGHSS